ncbi:MAG: dephospho-CoA kinase [Isosphaera sp.]|nr:dephospho-CoA kinase [Isosphaera sp.]
MTAFRHVPKPVIGLVGEIGAGKSTVARLLAARGGRVIDADALGHAALADPAVVTAAVLRWGDGVRRPDGGLDRRAVARVVFADPAERAALEALVFPLIRGRVAGQVRDAMADPAARFVVLDAAVMLEAGWNNATDRLVYVSAPREVRLARVAARSGWADADLAAREAAQWPADRKRAAADAVLVNDAGPSGLTEQVDRLLKEWGLGSEE